MLSPTILASALLCLAVADDFDAYTNSVLAKVGTAEAAKSVQQIRLTELFATKPVIGRENGCFVVVRTDEGNWAKLLLRPSYRKNAEGDVPLVVIERYQCMRPGTENGRLSAGKDIYLFNGFQFNLDIGQVVPDGEGGDIAFHREGTGGFLQSVGSVKMYIVTKPLIPPAGRESNGVSAGPVVPEDFAGSFRLIASGKWSGQLKLEVSSSNEVHGSYISDQTGADYPVKGFVARPSHHIKFTIELPMVEQEFDGFLWTQGKNAIAGTTTLAGNTFGFVAVRAGTELTPKDEK